MGQGKPKTLNNKIQGQAGHEFLVQGSTKNKIVPSTKKATAAETYSLSRYSSTEKIVKESNKTGIKQQILSNSKSQTQFD